MLDATVSANYPSQIITPHLRIEPRCNPGASTPYYWQSDTYCGTSATATVDFGTIEVIGQTQHLQFKIERPGLYRVFASIEVDGNKWALDAVDLDIHPGAPDPGMTTLDVSTVVHSSTTPVAGATFSFVLQANDLAGNELWGMEEVYVEARTASLEEVGPPPGMQSSSYSTVPSSLITQRLTADSTDHIEPGSNTGMFSFNLTFGDPGVFSVTIWVCPANQLSLCSPSSVGATPIEAASPLVLTICPSNSLIPSFNEDSGVLSGPQLQDCVCETGYFGDNGGIPRPCEACDAGKYSEDVGSTICESCLAGRSCDCTQPTTSKLPCGVEAGKAACTSCIRCRATQYQDRAGQGTCLDCPTGFQCPIEGMTFPVAKPGFWISADNQQIKHDCAVAGHMPEACPGGNLSALHSECYQVRLEHWDEHQYCKPVVGATCNSGYWGRGCVPPTPAALPAPPACVPAPSLCPPPPLINLYAALSGTFCCKAGQEECSHLESKGMKESWYLNEESGLCLECPDQDLTEVGVMLIFGLLIGQKLSKFAEVAKLSGELHAPLVSLITFFQVCDLFKTIRLHWPLDVRLFIENVLSVFSFNIHMLHVHPECQMSLTYTEKWLLKMLLPAFLWILLYFQYLLRYFLYLYASGNCRIKCTALAQTIMSPCWKPKPATEIVDGDAPEVHEEHGNPLAELTRSSPRRSVVSRVRSVMSSSEKVVSDQFVTFEKAMVSGVSGEDLSSPLSEFGLKFEYKLRPVEGQTQVGIFVTAIRLDDDRDYERLSKIEVGQQLCGVYSGAVTADNFGSAIGADQGVHVMGAQLVPAFLHSQFPDGTPAMADMLKSAAQMHHYGGLISATPINPSMELLLSALQTEARGVKAFKR